MPKSLIAKPKPKPPKPRFFRYAVRIGRSPGIYAAYDQARPQVEGMPACHMGFTRAQVRLGLHHYYMQQTLSDKQVRKLKEGGGRAASRPCEGSQPSVRGAGLLAGRAVKGVS